MGRQTDAGLVLALESATDTIHLDPWLRNEYGVGVQALRGVAGFGFPLVQNQWFEGMGDGAVYLGTRNLPRVIKLPLHFEGVGRLQMGGILTRVSLALTQGARLTVQEPEGDKWVLPVRRESGGDWEMGGQQTDQRTWVRPDPLILRSENAFWVRDEPEFFKVESVSGRGLLPHLARLPVSGSTALGTRAVNNPGDAAGRPLWHLDGPGTDFSATSALGEVLAWGGTLLLGEWVEIDTITGLVVDNTGANRYEELGTAPVMWEFPPGMSTVAIVMDGTTAASKVICYWKPQRQTMI